MAKLTDEIMADLRGKRPNKTEGDDKAKDDDDDEYAGDAAELAGEVRAALDGDDDDELAAALKAFIKAC